MWQSREASDWSYSAPGVKKERKEKEVETISKSCKAEWDESWKVLKYMLMG